MDTTTVDWQREASVTLNTSKFLIDVQTLCKPCDWKFLNSSSTSFAAEKTIEADTTNKLEK